MIDCAGTIWDLLFGPYLLQEFLDGKIIQPFATGIARHVEFHSPYIKRVMWLQQVGVPALYVRDVQNYSDITFYNWWIKHGAPLDWLMWLSDFSCLDFFSGDSWRLLCMRQLLNLQKTTTPDFHPLEAKIFVPSQLYVNNLFFFLIVV